MQAFSSAVRKFISVMGMLKSGEKDDGKRKQRNLSEGKSASVQITIGGDLNGGLNMEDLSQKMSNLTHKDE